MFSMIKREPEQITYSGRPLNMFALIENLSSLKKWCAVSFDEYSETKMDFTRMSKMC